MEIPRPEGETTVLSYLPEKGVEALLPSFLHFVGGVHLPLELIIHHKTLFLHILFPVLVPPPIPPPPHQGLITLSTDSSLDSLIILIHVSHFPRKSQYLFYSIINTTT